MLLSIIGGLLIGLSAALLFAALGKIAGISGLLWRVVSQPRVSILALDWHVWFLLGLMLAPAILVSLTLHSVPAAAQVSWPTLIIAGLLVGFGTRLGSGCTSGHGVCGIARLSPRSLLATLIFMFTGIVVVSVVRHLLQ